MNHDTQPDAGALSTRLARFAHDLRAEDVPAAVLEHARLCILDATGIALAARAQDYSHALLDAVHALGESGNSPIFGQAQRAPLRDAVLANGSLVHSLDFDDTHSASVVHCSASAWPVAFAVAHHTGSSGMDALLAYIIAVELDARIGEIAGGSLQRRGHHPTGVIAAFGAAAAAARLMRLDVRSHANALGITLSMASGNMEFINDGAWTKRLHPGWAGVAGITAATFAAHGYRGPGAPLEGRFGLFRTLLDTVDEAAVAALGHDLGRSWRTTDVAIKPYPACHFNHVFADCALALRHTHGLVPADIASITALVHPDQAPLVCEPLVEKQKPNNAYEAQFSIPYMVAAALCRDRFTLAELEPDCRGDADILGLAARTDWRADPDSSYPDYFSGGLEVTLRDGRVLHEHRAVHRGSPKHPIAAADIRAKYHDNADAVLGRAGAEALADTILALDHARNLDAVVDLVTAGATQQTPARLAEASR